MTITGLKQKIQEIKEAWNNTSTEEWNNTSTEEDTQRSLPMKSLYMDLLVRKY